MLWDFGEANIFGSATGSWRAAISQIPNALLYQNPAVNARVSGEDAATRNYSPFVLSTDPPYYDNIGYSDLSDFFYVWLRRTLRSVYPSQLSTMLVPKAEELVANPYRHGGKDAAREFFKRVSIKYSLTPAARHRKTFPRRSITPLSKLSPTPGEPHLPGGRQSFLA